MALSSREMEDLRHDREYQRFDAGFSIPDNTEEFYVGNTKFSIDKYWSKLYKGGNEIGKYASDEELKMLIYLNK